MKPLDSTKNSSKGSECYFYEIENKGLKVYPTKLVAERARATQEYFWQKDLAPKTLSDVLSVPIIIFPTPNSCIQCPLGIYLYFEKNSYYIYTEMGSYVKANCSDRVLKQPGTHKIYYGYYTEIAITDKNPDLGLDNFLRDIKGILDSYLLSGCDGDMHVGNIGIINNKPVIIDFGRHFYRSLRVNITNEIDNLIQCEDCKLELLN